MEDVTIKINGMICGHCEKTVTEAAKNEVMLKMGLMHCASCALNIETALKKTAGITSVNVSFPLERARISYDPGQISVHDMIKIIEGMGYTASEKLDRSDADRKQRARDEEIKRRTYKGLRHGMTDMNLLIATGTGAAYAVSTAGTFLKLGRYLEVLTKGKTSEAIRKLMGLAAKTARIVVNGEEKEIPVEDVKINAYRREHASGKNSRILQCGILYIH